MINLDIALVDGFTGVCHLDDLIGCIYEELVDATKHSDYKVDLQITKELIYEKVMDAIGTTTLDEYIRYKQRLIDDEILEPNT